MYTRMFTKAILIPVYKPCLTVYETLSLKRYFEVFSKYQIIILGPKSLDYDEYYKSYGFHNCYNFDDHYFKNVNGYSKLLLSPEFYRKFIEFDYILVAQLDAFVFSDQLDYWCSQGFDYVGAPWVNAKWPNSSKYNDFLPFWARRRKLRDFLGLKPSYVGNGGFSLRNVKKSMIVLKILGALAGRWPYSEDIFWSYIVPFYLPKFMKIPEVDVALKFAFEIEPRRCFTMNGGALPFGCHAWERYDIDFWRPIFHEFGYEI